MRENEKMKRVATTLAIGFICWQCVKTIKEQGKEILCFDQAEFVKSFCYLGTG